MNKRREVTSVKFFGGLVVLAGLIVSFGFPAQTQVQAEKMINVSETVSENNLRQTDYGKTRLMFEENKGQTDEAVKFVSRGSGYTLYLTETGATFQLKRIAGELKDDIPKTSKKIIKSDELKMNFVGANLKPKVSGDAETVTKTNYYIGKKRFENLSNFQKVNYKNLYDGIDAVFYGNGANQLEYDFELAPNADANQIALDFESAENLSIDENGNLVIKTANTELVQQKPIAFQIINGEKREVEVRYIINEQSQIANQTSQISFALGDYDRSQPLTIDPALNYLTYIGGTAFDDVFEIAADAQGNAYISGKTASLNFHGETRDSSDALGAYVAKINATGTDFVYITILEGNGDDAARGIALDGNNNAYLTGIASRFFPTTSGAYDTVHGAAGSEDAFAAKLNDTGGLVYSSFLGGSDQDKGFDIAVDAGGKAYVVGSTFSATAFPSKNKYQGCGFAFPGTFDSLDAFLTVFNASGSDITYSTCIGNTTGAIGSSDEEAFSVALDSSNNAYVTGITNSDNFKVKNAFQPEIGGGQDAWVAKFNPAASGDASVIYATFLGGAGTDQGNGIAVNAGGQAHIVGLTGSTNFPLLNAFRSTNQINEGFVTILNSSGSTLVNSSFLGGADQDNALNVALDPTGSIYVTGSTLSNNFPMALPFQSTRRGVRDAFVTKLKFGRGIISSSYIGGNGSDSGDGIAVKGNFIYVAGDTASTNLATTSGVIAPTFNGETDGFIAKILDTRLDSVGVFRPNVTFQVTQSITNITTQTLPFTTPLSGARGVSGDFDGDGIDTTGTFTNGVWKVRNINFPIGNFPAITFNFGSTGDLPVVGDWDGDGVDTAGTFRPSAGQFFLTNSPNAQAVNATINFGIAEDLPVAGDWNGDGIDSVGVFRPSTGQFFLTDDNVAGATIDQTFFFGINGDLPTAGDWNGNGIDTIGVWRPATREFFLTNDNINISNVFLFGQINTDQPLAGDWDGRPLP